MKSYKHSGKAARSSLLKDHDTVYLMNTSRKGIPFSTFTKIASRTPFTAEEWSAFLHLSGRSIQRYKKENRPFDPIHSEKILEIALLYDRGTEVFGHPDHFNQWLETDSIALGGKKPKEFLDSTFGIGLLKDELIRLEHGVPA